MAPVVEMFLHTVRSYFSEEFNGYRYFLKVEMGEIPFLKQSFTSQSRPKMVNLG